MLKLTLKAGGTRGELGKMASWNFKVTAIMAKVPRSILSFLYLIPMTLILKVNFHVLDKL